MVLPSTASPAVAPTAVKNNNNNNNNNNKSNNNNTDDFSDGSGDLPAPMKHVNLTALTGLAKVEPNTRTTARRRTPHRHAPRSHRTTSHHRTARRRPCTAPHHITVQHVAEPGTHDCTRGTQSNSAPHPLCTTNRHRTPHPRAFITPHCVGTSRRVLSPRTR
jgi:hypothetical protein